MEISSKIEYIDNKKTLLIENNSLHTLTVEYFNTPENIGWPLLTAIKPDHWFRAYISETNIDSFIIKNDDGLLFLYKIEGDNINKIPPASPNSVTPYSPFIWVTGYQGSGTSIIVKSFRYFGAHNGDDSGSFENRKTHESVNLRTFFNLVFPKDYKYGDILQSFYNVMGAYNYKKDKVNILKLLHIQECSNKLVNFFPNLKFISVSKHQENNSLSPEAKKFSEAKQIDILKVQNPPLEGQPIFHLDWNMYFTDYTYCQKVLNYIGLEVQLDENKFNEMLRVINFDTSKLKNKI